MKSLRDLEMLLGLSGRTLREVAGRAGSFYRPFDIRRPGTGKWRHIDNPTGQLKLIQHSIKRKVLGSYPVHAAMFGGVPGRSVEAAASLHLGKECVVGIDIRDFFPMTHHSRVNALLRSTGWEPRCARLLTQLTTFQHRLPQGAPTSVTLGNLVLRDLCTEVVELCTPRGINVSFYVDDITLSGRGEPVREIIQPVVNLVTAHGYAIRSNKIRIMASSGRQEVLGLVVNRERLSAGRSRISLIRDEAIDRSAEPLIPVRVRGRVCHVEGVSSAQGAALKRLVTAIWEASTPGRYTKKKGSETRPCRHARRHSRERSQRPKGLGRRKTSAPSSSRRPMERPDLGLRRAARP